MNRTIASLAIFASMFVPGVTPQAHAQQQCSNASIRGAYGFHAFATILPAGTPRAIIGVFNFDGTGHLSSTLTLDDNGTISTRPDTGTYVVNADCTGTIFPTSGGSVEIVVVDGGREIYQMRTNPATIVLFGTTKKLFPGESGDSQGH